MWNDGTCTRKEAGPTAGDLVPGRRRVEKKKKKKRYDTSSISFIRIHEINQRSTPEKYLLYKHALALYKLYWSDEPTNEFCALNYNSILTSRQTNFITTKDNKRRVGLNALANRFYPLNNRIPLMQLNKSLNSYKIFCKNEFLK